MNNFLNVSNSDPNLSKFSRFQTITRSNKLKRSNCNYTTESTKVSNSFFDYVFIERIKSRNSHVKIEITPRIAANVIRQYFIPMFENNSREQLKRQRSASLGFRTKNKLKKFKLSEKIKSKLDLTNIQVEKLHIKLKKTVDETISIKNEVLHLKNNLDNSLSLLEDYKFGLKICCCEIKKDANRI